MLCHSGHCGPAPLARYTWSSRLETIYNQTQQGKAALVMKNDKIIIIPRVINTGPRWFARAAERERERERDSSAK